MAHFNLTFHVQGIGPGGSGLTFPVNPIDDLVVIIAGMEVKTFRFTVENILNVPVTINMDYTQSGCPSRRAIDVTFVANPLLLQPGEIGTVTATITPLTSLDDGDLIDVTVTGQQA